MVIIGVTGMIASGKSTVSGILAEKTGAPVFNADAEAKKIIKDMGIDNLNVVGNPMKLYQIEHNVIPELIKSMQDFVASNKDDKFVILDVALLYEFDMDQYCDVVINVFCNFDTRAQRAQKRAHMNIDKFVFLNNKQINDDARNSKATFCVNNESDIEKIRGDVEEILKRIDAGDYTRH